MADRPDVSINKILAGVRARTRPAKWAAHRLADRQIEQVLLYAIWLRDGRGGKAPACEAGLLSLAEEYATIYPDALAEWARALSLKGLLLSAEACWVLCRFAEVQTLH